MRADLLARLKQAGAWLAQPASAADLEALAPALAKAGLPALPPAYRDFLARCDGLLFSGLTLHGARSHGEVSARVDIGDLQTANTPPLSGQLVIGAEEDAIFTFAAESNTWQVVDLLDKAVLESYASFDALCTDTFARRLAGPDFSA